MSKQLGTLGWGLIVLGFLLGYVGGRIGQMSIVGAGVLMGGAGLILEGLKGVLTQQAELSNSYHGRSESYRGLNAVLMGMMWMIFGFAAFAAGLAVIVGQGDRVLAYIRQHPGLVLLPGGAAMFAFGGSSLLGAKQDQPSASFWRFLGSLPARMLGLLVMIVGVLVSAMGGLELLFPAVYQNVLYNLGSIFTSRLGF